MYRVVILGSRDDLGTAREIKNSLLQHIVDQNLLVCIYDSENKDESQKIFSCIGDDDISAWIWQIKHSDLAIIIQLFDDSSEFTKIELAIAKSENIPIIQNYGSLDLLIALIQADILAKKRITKLKKNKVDSDSAALSLISRMTSYPCYPIQNAFPYQADILAKKRITKLKKNAD